MKEAEERGLKSDTASTTFVPQHSPFVSRGGELRLSNLGQLELLRGMVERGAALRTVVRGFSMTPFIRNGDVVTVIPMNGREPRVGDVIAFTLPRGGRLALHRVIAHVGDGWLLRGDNSPKSDGVVSRENILGRVTRVERQGRTVRLGLGVEGMLISLLQRTNLLTRLAYLTLRAQGGYPCQSASNLPED